MSLNKVQKYLINYSVKQLCCEDVIVSFKAAPPFKPDPEIKSYIWVSTVTTVEPSGQPAAVRPQNQ